MPNRYENCCNCILNFIHTCTSSQQSVLVVFFFVESKLSLSLLSDSHLLKIDSILFNEIQPYLFREYIQTITVGEVEQGLLHSGHNNISKVSRRSSPRARTSQTDCEPSHQTRWTALKCHAVGFVLQTRAKT